MLDFSEKTKTVLRLAENEAEKWKHTYCGTEHLLVALMQVPSATASTLSSSNITVRMIRDVIGKFWPPGLDSIGTRPTLTPRLKQTMENAKQAATSLGHATVCPAHLLLGMTQVVESNGLAILHSLNVKPHELCDRIMTALQEKLEAHQIKQEAVGTQAKLNAEDMYCLDFQDDLGDPIMAEIAKLLQKKIILLPNTQFSGLVVTTIKKKC